MFIPFDSLPDSSRLWIYQADRKISSDEKTILESRLRLYTDQWVAHGHPLECSFDIRFDQFLILAVNESIHAPSGCSIDDSVRIVKQLGEEFKIDWFNRNQVAFQINNAVKLVPLNMLKQQYSAGEWSLESLMFNNLIQSKAELHTNWLIPAGDSWLKRYVPGEKVLS